MALILTRPWQARPDLCTGIHRQQAAGRNTYSINNDFY